MHTTDCQADFIKYNHLKNVCVFPCNLRSLYLYNLYVPTFCSLDISISTTQYLFASRVNAKHRDIFKSNLAICLKRQVYNSCVLPAMTYGAETWTLTKQAQNKLAAAQTKMERSMLNITYKDRKTNIWVRERTKVIDIINTVRKMKWSWAGHINRLKDDRWTSRVTSWRPYDKKRRQGRPAKRWRDDLDKYWSDTIWQRKAQDRVVWRQHAEAFAQPRDTTAA